MTPDTDAVEAMAKEMFARRGDIAIGWAMLYDHERTIYRACAEFSLARLAVVEGERDAARAQVVALRAALASMVEHWLEPEPTGHTVARDGVGMDCGCDDCESYHSRIGAIKRAHAALASTRLAAAESTPTPNTKEDYNAGI